MGWAAPSELEVQSDRRQQPHPRIVSGHARSRVPLRRLLVPPIREVLQIDEGNELRPTHDEASIHAQVSRKNVPTRWAL